MAFCIGFTFYTCFVLISRVPLRYQSKQKLNNNKRAVSIIVYILFYLVSVGTSQACEHGLVKLCFSKIRFLEL